MFLRLKESEKVLKALCPQNFKHLLRLFIFFFNIIYFNWGLITLQYCIGFAIHQHESATSVHMFQSWTPLPPPSPYHPSRSSQCTSPKHPVSCIEPGLVIRFIYDTIHVSLPFSQIIPPSPSPTESKRLFYTSVYLLLSHIQSYHYHLSKFHIYALVYCIRRRQWHPTPVLLPRKSHGWRSLVGCSSWGR